MALRISSTLALLAVILLSEHANAQRQSGGGGSDGPSAISETQERRASQRFNIIDWIRRNNEIKAAQDAKYGRGGSSGRGPFPDFVLHYRTSPNSVSRDGVTVGRYNSHLGRFQFLLDDLFSSGNKFRVFNSDLGVEATYTSTRDFTAEAGFSQNRYEFKELSGALLVRPIGRSSQDSGLTFKFGYLNSDAQGFWANASSSVNLYAPFAGVDLKLYLVPFLGLKGEYQYALETEVSALSGKWKSSRFTYGAYLEIYLISLEAYMFTHETSLSLNSGGAIKEVTTGTALGASLYF